MHCGLCGRAGNTAANGIKGSPLCGVGGGGSGGGPAPQSHGSLASFSGPLQSYSVARSQW